MITSEVANHVLFFFGEGGYRPGSFTESLLSAIARADQFNRAKLARGFPEYVQAMTAAMEDLDGIDSLKAVAGNG